MIGLSKKTTSGLTFLVALLCIASVASGVDLRFIDCGGEIWGQRKVIDWRPIEIIRVDSPDSVAVLFSIPARPQGSSRFVLFSELQLLIIDSREVSLTTMESIRSLIIIGLSGPAITSVIEFPSSMSSALWEVTRSTDSVLFIRFRNIESRDPFIVEDYFIPLEGPVDSLHDSIGGLHLNNRELVSDGFPYSGGTVPMKNQPKIAPRDSDLECDLGEFPDKLVRREDKRGYNLLTYDEGFGLFYVLPDSAPPADRAYLILNQKSGVWSRLSTPATKAPLRPVNGYLVAESIDSGLITIEASGKDSSMPVSAQDAIILDPLTMVTRTARIGSSSRLLWVQADTVAFRIMDELREGEMQPDGTVRSHVLLVDKRVPYLIWAFRPD